MKSWRDDPITEKQKKLIVEMFDFSEFPLPSINLETATKGEASDYINANLIKAHECFDINEDMYGNWD